MVGEPKVVLVAKSSLCNRGRRMQKQSLVLTLFLLVFPLVGCSSPAPSVSSASAMPKQIKEPQIGAPYLSQVVQRQRTSNCDGQSRKTTISRSLQRGEATSFQVEVEAGGLVKGTPIPGFLEAELEAKIKAALARVSNIALQDSVSFDIETVPGNAYDHSITWNETRVKGIIELVYPDATAKVSFERVISLELADRISNPVGCSVQSLPTNLQTTTPTVAVMPPTQVAQQSSSRNATSTPLPIRTSTATIAASSIRDYQKVSLKQIGIYETSNLGLGAGTNTLLGIPFDTGWTATTQCADNSSPTTYQVNTSITRPTNVYLLLQAGWGMKDFSGKQIGSVVANFSDGKQFNTLLTLGVNIRDWARSNPSAVSTFSSSALREGWRGTAPDRSIGGMDILTIEIPNEYRNATLSGLQITDTSTSTAGSTNPCIHLLAITVEFLR